MSTFIQYIRDTRAELVHVVWPSRRQALGFTLIVIGVSIVVSLLLGFFDYLFSLIIQKFVIG
ncbi:preprotein translocase subunit SecE [Candidatus Parcubacteria bacterium]|nr:preprotein translocase subunit SecE [Candidatus Parcubacteria bacterium]